jgi:hypothetical protein
LYSVLKTCILFIPPCGSPIAHPQLDAVDFFLARPSLLRAVRRQLSACQDTERCLQRLALGRGSPRDLLAVARSIVRARSVHALIEQSAAADCAVGAAVAGAAIATDGDHRNAAAGNGVPTGGLRRRVGSDESTARLSMPGFVPTFPSSPSNASEASRNAHSAGGTVLSDEDDPATAASEAEQANGSKEFDFDAPDDTTDAGLAASETQSIEGVPALINAHAQCLNSTELCAWANHILRGASRSLGCECFMLPAHFK